MLVKLKTLLKVHISFWPMLMMIIYWGKAYIR